LDAKPIVIWTAALVAVLAIAFALHLPERMGCHGRGRYMTCQHSLLSPETWGGR
jgi:hypothetical protein